LRCQFQTVATVVGNMNSPLAAARILQVFLKIVRDIRIVFDK
jgi:hypothetical protein